MKADLEIQNLNEIYQWQLDPVERFMKPILGWNPWSKQREIINSVRDNQRTAVRSCHTSGKTAVAGRIGIWFLYSFYPSIVITTAPTWNQVQKQLWGEIRSAYGASKIPLGGNLLRNELRLSEIDDWYMFGFAPEDRDWETIEG